MNWKQASEIKVNNESKWQVNLSLEGKSCGKKRKKKDSDDLFNQLKWSFDKKPDNNT